MANNNDVIDLTNPVLVPDYGGSVDRPYPPSNGEMYFDATLGIPTWYNGSEWVDSNGLPV